MIHEIRQSIVHKLNGLYPEISCYLDSIPQDAGKPLFLFSVCGQTYEKRRANIYRSTLSLDVAYYPAAGQAAMQSDCLEVQETLLRNFDAADGFRITNKNAKSTDQVLHFTFDVNYLEKQVEPRTFMGTVTTQFISKE